MEIDKERIEELVSLYSLGILEDEEIEEFRGYIQSDSGEIQKLINDNELVTSLLFYSSDSKTPPEGLKNRLMQRIKLNRSLEKEKYKPSFWEKISPFWYGIGGAVAATAMLLLLFNFAYKDNYLNELQLAKNLNQEQQTTIDSLKADLLTKEEKIAQLTKLDSMKTELVGYIENPSVVVVDIASLKADLNSLGRILFDSSESKAVFCGLNLPQTAPDKVYQLWAIIDSKPVDRGIFEVNEKGNGILRIDDVSDSKNIQQFAVTLEPAGGVPQPTGEMYLAGSFL